MILPTLPPQYKTWKEFWWSLSPHMREPKSSIRVIRMLQPETFNEIDYHINEIKEGVFQEALAVQDPEDFNYDELLLIKHELSDLNVFDYKDELRKSALEKVQTKLYKIIYPEK